MRRITVARSVGLVLTLVGSYTSAAELQVSVRNFVFDPAVLEIQVGDTVTWTNTGGVHNVDAPGFFRCANGCDGEGGNGDPSSNAWSFSVVFDSPGQIDYVCDQHAALGMAGTVTVVDAGTLSLAVTGSCPGPVTIDIAGGEPGGSAGIAFSPFAGSDVIPAGTCAGVATGLASPQGLALVPLDANGAGQLNPIAPAGACGVLLQAVDFTTCNTSNLAAVPGAASRREHSDAVWGGL